jgi:radical SAM superfamily enzyme YgiQ (UPF0313 family)
MEKENWRRNIMIDVLLIRSNDQKNVYGEASKFTACEPPFWMATIASYLRQRDMSVEILDAEALNLSLHDTLICVKEKKPSCIGLIVTGTNLSASTQKMDGAELLCTTIKSDVHTPIFMWGVHPSALPEATLKESDADFVVRGESMQTIYELIAYIKNKQTDFVNIRGLFYRIGTEIRGNSDITLMDINEMPSPAWDLLDMKKYHPHDWHTWGDTSFKGEGYGVISTSLGCPYPCTFCAISKLFGKRAVRYKKPEKVIAEIDVLVKDYGIKYFRMLDENFLLNKEHVNAICDLLISRNYDVDFWAYARVDAITEDILAKLKAAGITWLGLGIESANEASLDFVNKKQTSLQKTKAAVKMIQNAGMYVHGAFMFGLPDDTIESMEQTLQLARSLNPEDINFYCTQALPGSVLYEQCIENGIELPEKWIGFSQLGYESRPLATKYLSAKEVLAFRDSAFNRFYENNEKYFTMIEQKFGKATVEKIKVKISTQLKRRILENTRYDIFDQKR